RFSRDWSSDVCSSDRNWLKKYGWLLLAIAIVCHFTFHSSLRFYSDELNLILSAFRNNQQGKWAAVGLANGHVTYGPLPTWFYQRSEARRVGKECSASL